MRKLASLQLLSRRMPLTFVRRTQCPHIKPLSSTVCISFQRMGRGGRILLDRGHHPYSREIEKLDLCVEHDHQPVKPRLQDLLQGKLFFPSGNNVLRSLCFERGKWFCIAVRYCFSFWNAPMTVWKRVDLVDEIAAVSSANSSDRRKDGDLNGSLKQ